MKINANDFDSNDIIRIIREWTELTQKEFGKSIKRSERSVQNLELGERNYTFKNLQEICKKHGIDIIIQKKEGK